MQRYYELQNAFLKGAVTAYRDFPLDTYQFMRGELPMETPIPFPRNMGHRLYDAVHCDVGVQLFHNRFFDAMRREGVTGFDSLPATITMKDKEIHDYRCLIVKGRAYNIDYDRGEIIDKGPMVPGGISKIVKKGLYFDESTWDGSDFFLLDKTLHLIVTEKVKDIVEKMNLTNILFTDTVDVEDDIHHLSVDNPERLQYYKDQLKAKTP